MQWTESIRQMKIWLIAAAVLIAVASLFASHYFTKDLEKEERGRMEIWGEAMRSLDQADQNTDLNLVLEVINGNHTIPVMVLGRSGKVQTYRNISLEATSEEDSLAQLERLKEHFINGERRIRIQLDNGNNNDFIDVYYGESVMLKRLAWYPYVQLSVVIIFVAVAIFALLSSKKAEQNRVWAGLSKETAHQLGTPISSLMAWTEMLKETYPNDELLPEMEKDVKRLRLIADRFSKIGSQPEASLESMNEVIGRVAEYMDRRTSRRIKIDTALPDDDIKAEINASLFEWVLENMAKNAADAIGESTGRVTFRLSETADKVAIEVSDTGKGIRKKDLKNVFRPGFTTKQRGWGLGLSLARRIVEEYHKGKIMVKSTEVGKGTTFCITLKKQP